MGGKDARARIRQHEGPPGSWLRLEGRPRKRGSGANGWGTAPFPCLGLPMLRCYGSLLCASHNVSYATTFQ